MTGLKSAKKPALIHLSQVLGVPEIVPTYHKNGTERAVSSEEYVTRIIQRLIDIKGELEVCEWRNFGVSFVAQVRCKIGESSVQVRCARAHGI